MNTGIHTSPFFLHFVAQAREIIARAERDLGSQPFGPRSDLLADNTGWSLDTIHEIVRYLEQDPSIPTEALYPFCSKCHDHHRAFACPAMD